MVDEVGVGEQKGCYGNQLGNPPRPTASYTGNSPKYQLGKGL